MEQILHILLQILLAISQRAKFTLIGSSITDRYFFMCLLINVITSFKSCVEPVKVLVIHCNDGLRNNFAFIAIHFCFLWRIIYGF